MKVFFVLLLITSNILAAPAAPGFRVFYQHDGTSFEAEGHGDEYFSWIEDKQGRVIEYNPASYNYEYSVLTEQDGALTLTHSGVAATDYTPVGVSSSLGSKTAIIAIEKSTLAGVVKKSKLNSSHYLQKSAQQEMINSLMLDDQLNVKQLEWVESIASRVRSYWRYQGAKSDWSCYVYIKQDRDGRIEGIDIDACNLDDSEKERSFKNSIERATMKSSPLPSAPDGALFSEQVLFEFRVDAVEIM